MLIIISYNIYYYYIMPIKLGPYIVNKIIGPQLLSTLMPHPDMHEKYVIF